MPELTVPLSTSGAHIGPSLLPRHHAWELGIKAFGSDTGLILLWGLVTPAGFMLLIHGPALVINLVPPISQAPWAWNVGNKLCIWEREIPCALIWFSISFSPEINTKDPFHSFFLIPFIIINWNTCYVLDTGKSVANDQDKIGLWPLGAYSIFGDTDTKQILLISNMLYQLW